MSQTQLIIIAIQALLIIVGGLVAYYAFVVKVNARLTDIEAWIQMRKEVLSTDKLGEMEHTIGKMKADNDIFWKVIEPHLANIIHSPIHRDRDELVDKLVTGKLADEEAPILTDALRTALNNPEWPSDKRLAASLLLARVLSMYDQRREYADGTRTNCPV